MRSLVLKASYRFEVMLSNHNCIK